MKSIVFVQMIAFGWMSLQLIYTLEESLYLNFTSSDMTQVLKVQPDY